MPFSKHPKTRQLKRALEEKDKEVKRLCATLTKSDSLDLKAAALTSPLLSSPEHAAIELLKAVDVTPRVERKNTLLPLTETVSRVKKAPMKVKRALFADRRSIRRMAKVLSKTIALSRVYIFNKRKGKNMRSSIARSHRTVVAEFLKKPENSYKLPSKKTMFEEQAPLA